MLKMNAIAVTCKNLALKPAKSSQNLHKIKIQSLHGVLGFWGFGVLGHWGRQGRGGVGMG